MKFVIDRIEGNFAVCQNLDNKEMIEISLEQLPEGYKEGCVIKKYNNKYVIDVAEEKERKKRIEEKMRNLWE